MKKTLLILLILFNHFFLFSQTKITFSKPLWNKMSNDVNEVISIDIDSTGLICSISSDISERNITDNETKLEKYILF